MYKNDFIISLEWLIKIMISINIVQHNMNGTDSFSFYLSFEN